MREEERGNRLPQTSTDSAAWGTLPLQIQAGSLLGRSRGERGGSARSHHAAAAAALRSAAELRAKQDKHIAAAEIMALAAAVHLDRPGALEQGLDTAVAMLGEAARYRSLVPAAQRENSRFSDSVEEPALADFDAKKVRPLLELVMQLADQQRPG